MAKPASYRSKILGLCAPPEDQRPYRWTKGLGHGVRGGQAHGHLEVRKFTMSTQRNQRRWERQHPMRLVEMLDRLHKVRLEDDEVDLARLCNGIGAQLHSCHVAFGTRGTLLTASPIWSTPAGAAPFDCCSGSSGNE
jgi:hypothetical protein